MTELKEFRLPDVGEGLTEADIVAWHVKPGDTVETNQIIVEIETAKAVVELPSPWDGTVARLLAEEGQTVDVGTPIIAVDVSGAPAAPGTTDYAERSVVPPAVTTISPPADQAPPERQAVLVGGDFDHGETQSGRRGGDHGDVLDDRRASNNKVAANRNNNHQRKKNADEHRQPKEHAKSPVQIGFLRLVWSRHHFSRRRS